MNMLLKPSVLIKLILALLLSIIGQQSALPWLEAIDPKNIHQELHTISSLAEVTVSDGLQYKTCTVIHDKQRAIFQREYEDRTIAHGVEGRYIWEYDGASEKEADPIFEGIVLGHQFHAQILLFDKLYDEIGISSGSAFDGKECLAMSGKQKDSTVTLYYDEENKPLGLQILFQDSFKISYRYSDWKNNQGIVLPYKIEIDDGNRIFNYHFTKIGLNEGSLGEYRAPNAVLTEEQKLIRLHRNIMDAHLFENTIELNKMRSDSLIIVSAGEIYKFAEQESKAFFERRLENRDYLIYDDLVRPIVMVSDDGTLGWVIVKVYAKGIRNDEWGNLTGALEFVCSWIELYEKFGEEWKMKGNVSNFQEGLK